MAKVAFKNIIVKTKNSSLLKRAKSVLVGGVNSPVRSFNYVSGDPIVIKKGQGSKVWDHDGNSYIDYVLSFGALILGHANKQVSKAVSSTIEDGAHFGATTLPEIELAELIKEVIPSMEKIRFVNSGTEAVMGAIRLARGITGRKKIIKFTNSYHGHADYLLVKGGSGLASLNLATSKGVPKEFIDQTVVVDINDREALRRAFDDHGRDIAAVIVEPVGGNYGVVSPDKSFLRYLREKTKSYKSLLIFDEVITGFRFGFSSVADILGIKPDITCLGKIIGGGLPIGAYGASNDIMQHLAPEGQVYQASTFAGNPVVMAAGKVTLEKLRSYKKSYKKLSEMAEDISFAFTEGAKKNNIKLSVSCYGAMFSVKFDKVKQFKQFYRKALLGGVFLAPSEYEANFISFAHSKDDIEKTKDIINSALGAIK
ncbi:MAG: glutamate-1-semialdehyde 2,1-aminomutase [Candidatus Zapsychrus exili]|nr:glutamate-1-semialdehyde 2,1-aminomutase [Candidatus Zapsychrus exili]